MIIKLPASYDVSHWRPIPDFSALNPRPLLVFTKATEGTTFVDDTFVTHFNGMRQSGILRGAYHFHRKANDPIAQARHFCDTIRPHITVKDVLVLDVEEGGETASQLQAWFVTVKAQFPANLLMIYSRKNILDPIPMTTSQKDFCKQIKVWTAGYPTNPDLFSTVPSYYVPDQTKWGPVWAWQYTATGQVGGSAAALDCNWLAPDFIEFLGEQPAPEPEPDNPITDVHIKLVAGSVVTYTRADGSQEVETA